MHLNFYLSWLNWFWGTEWKPQRASLCRIRCVGKRNTANGEWNAKRWSTEPIEMAVEKEISHLPNPRRSATDPITARITPLAGRRTLKVAQQASSCPVLTFRASPDILHFSAHGGVVICVPTYLPTLPRAITAFLQWARATLAFKLAYWALVVPFKSRPVIWAAKHQISSSQYVTVKFPCGRKCNFFVP